MTFILTVSPTEAVELLNGNLASLIRSWEVPLGTAYLAVKKEKPELHRYDSWNGEEWERHYILRKPSIGEWLQNGLVVAKCEITENAIQGVKDIGNATYIRMYGFRFSFLSVLDKPMEVGQFYRKPFKDCKANCEELPLCSELRLTRLPSRWQKVEVGE